MTAAVLSEKDKGGRVKGEGPAKRERAFFWSLGHA